MVNSTKQGDDIQELKLDVGLIKADITTIKRDMMSNQKIIIDRMDKFAFLSQGDYDRDVALLNIRLNEFEAEQKRIAKLVDAGGLKATNAIFGNVTKMAIIGLSVVVVVAIVYGIYLTAPAVQSAVGNVR